MNSIVKVTVEEINLGKDYEFAKFATSFDPETRSDLLNKNEEKLYRLNSIVHLDLLDIGRIFFWFHFRIKYKR